MIRLRLLKSGIKILILNKDDFEFLTEFPSFLGHPVDKQVSSTKRSFPIAQF